MSLAARCSASTCLSGLVFHKVFSPQLFVLVGETNWREASEFVTTFLQRGRGLVCMLIVAVVVTTIALAERARQRLQELWKRHGGHTVACAILVCVAFGMCHFDIFYKIGKSKTLEDIDVGNRFPYDNVTATLMAIHDVKAIAHEMQTAINVARQVRPGVVAITCGTSHRRVLHQGSCADLRLLSAHHASFDA